MRKYAALLFYAFAASIGLQSCGAKEAFTTNGSLQASNPNGGNSALSEDHPQDAESMLLWQNYAKALKSKDVDKIAELFDVRESFVAINEKKYIGRTKIKQVFSELLNKIYKNAEFQALDQNLNWTKVERYSQVRIFKDVILADWVALLPDGKRYVGRESYIIYKGKIGSMAVNTDLTDKIPLTVPETTKYAE